MGRTITISGHSDDVINVEGNGSGIDELNPTNNKATAIVMGENGKAARITMRYTGVWTAEIGQLDEDVPLATITVGESHGYSVEVKVENAISIVQERDRDD